MIGDAGTLAFDQIYYQSRASKGAGKLKLAQGGLGWKETATGQVTTIPSADFGSLQWLRAMRGGQLRIYLKNGQVAKFDGFGHEAREELASFAKENYGLALEAQELAVKGWNWGHTSIDGNHLTFQVDGKPAFDLPFTEVTTATVATKSEVAIEFAQPDVADRKVDSILEIRLYIPNPKQTTEEDSEDQDEKEDELGEAAAAAAQTMLEADPAQVLCEKIKEFSEINQGAGDTIALIPDLPCIVPRGRFEMDMAPNYLRLHGKSYDHKILYSSIVKLFLLPKADETHILFVMTLDPPIRQGQTRYPHLVMQFDKDEVIDIDLQNIDEETIKTKYEGKLQMHYEAPTFEVVSTLFRLLANQKIIVPGSFRSAAGSNSIKCNIKANEGFLYPLERNFLFVPKNVTLIPHADIAQVEFSRMGAGLGNPRSFDVKFYLNSGTDITFSNVSKEEYFTLEEFLKQKNISFHSVAEESGSGRAMKKAERFDGTDGEEEDEDDGGREAKRLRAGLEQEESSDEDYRDSGSEESSVDEEYDEDYETGDEEEDGDEDEDEEEEEEEEEEDEDEE